MHPQAFYSEAEISRETTEVMIVLCKGKVADARPFGDQAWKITYDSEDDLKRLMDLCHSEGQQDPPSPMVAPAGHSLFEGPEENGVTLDMDDPSSVSPSAVATPLDASSIKAPTYSFEQQQILAKLPRIHHRSRIRAHQENMALLEASQESLIADVRAFGQVAAENDWAGQRIYSRLFSGVGPTMLYATKSILTWAEKEKKRLKKARQKGKLEVGIAGKDDPQTLGRATTYLSRVRIVILLSFQSTSSIRPPNHSKTSSLSIRTYTRTVMFLHFEELPPDYTCLVLSCLCMCIRSSRMTSKQPSRLRFLPPTPRCTNKP
jgi:hypothetical protein